jgi:TATA-binding protein-associated factor Taf7
MSNTEQNNARFHSDLSEKHADKVIAYVAKMLAEDVKTELHDAQIYAIEGNDLETAQRIKLKQQMVEETIKALKRTLLK